MRLLSKTKDGGPDSPVDAYFLIEIKWLFSIALLKFNKGGREQFHTHAFNALTWFICGKLLEKSFDTFPCLQWYSRSVMPKVTRRAKNHRVYAVNDSWCLTVRGPWTNTWTEDDQVKCTHTVFTHGRKVLELSKL